MACGAPTPRPVSVLTIHAVRHPEKATAEPTLRSISPAIITMVIPKAMIPCMEEFLSTLKKLSTEKNPGAVKDRKIQSMTNMERSICFLKGLFFDIHCNITMPPYTLRIIVLLLNLPVSLHRRSARAS